METSLNHFVLLVVGGAFVMVLGLAVISRYLHYRSEVRSLKRRVICRLCLHAFECFHEEEVVPCPVCQAQNDRRTGM